MTGARSAGEAASPENDLETGRWLFAQTAEFVRGVARLEQLPPADRVEVAFCGRSNVGKSSLLNALTGRKSLARTSNTPGRTRELNFFALPPDKPGLYLVDLPGYGYAQASKSHIEAWTRLTMNYLRGRASLRRVYLLIDARHGLKASDEDAISQFDIAAVSFRVLLTKSDKVKPGVLSGVITRTEAALAKHPAAYPQVLATSSLTGEGLEELRAEIAGFLDLTALGYKNAGTAQ